MQNLGGNHFQARLGGGIKEALPGNPYDEHILKAVHAQVEQLTGVKRRSCSWTVVIVTRSIIQQTRRFIFQVTS